MMDLSAWYSLSSAAGLGPKKLATVALALMKNSRRAEDIVGADVDELTAMGIPASIASKCVLALTDILELELPQSDAEVVTPDHRQFPLDRLQSPVPIPVFLYARGNLGLLSARGIAISGSRRAHPLALDYAKLLATIAASKGLNVVAGLAAGIDEAAHRAALEAEGTTSGVLAEGIDQARVGDDEPKDSFLLLSQFQPSAGWSRFNAMARNATIASLADMVVVVAASLKGGSWEQAQLCLRSGIPLAVTDFDSSVAEGNQALIKRGAVALNTRHPEEAFSLLQTTPTREPASLF